MAAKVAPEDMPPNTPSTSDAFLAYSNASSLSMVMTPSRILVSKLSGIKPAPMPWMGCGAGLPPLITGDKVGSTAKTFSVGKCFFNILATPVICPPVPTPVIR